MCSVHQIRLVLLVGGVIRDFEFTWTLGITHKIPGQCIFYALFRTLKETLIKAWDYHLDNIEVDLERSLIERLQRGPLHSPPHLRELIVEIGSLMSWKWTINVNYVKRPVNFVVAVLAELNKEQQLVTVAHFRSPKGLQVALVRDEEAYKL